MKSNSNAPKYKQIINSVEEAIIEGKLKVGDSLPSINFLRDEFKLSRDTVLNAYNELKVRGIIHSIVGKGYYVLNDHIEVTKKILVLFDELNSFKEDLYNSFIEHLEPHVRVDIYFHHFNQEMFSKLIRENTGHYNEYVIMPANLKGVEVDIEQLPENKVYLLDQTRKSLSKYASVHQNFEKDIYSNLTKLLPELLKYDRLNLIYSVEKQPEGLLKGFGKFCTKHLIPFRILHEVNQVDINPKEAYIIPDDKDLIRIIKMMKDAGYTLKKDLGIISYNDTLLKEIVEGGITSISTDFKQMGALLAQMIQNNQREVIENPSYIIKRNSI